MEITTRQRRIILPLGNESGGSYGYDYDFPEIELPEIVVTPDGVYKGEGWDDFSGWGNDDYNDQDPYGLGGGSHSGNGDSPSEAEIHAFGMQAVNLFSDSIFNKTAIWLKEIQETKTFKTITTSNLIANAPGLETDIIKSLVSDEEVLKAWGKVFSKTFIRGNAVAGEVIALIGILDGEPTTGDFLILAGSTLGLAGAVFNLVPVVGITVTGLSLVLTLVGTCMNEAEKTKSY